MCLFFPYVISFIKAFLLNIEIIAHLKLFVFYTRCFFVRDVNVKWRCDTLKMNSEYI